MRARIFWGAATVALVTLIVGVVLAGAVNRSFDEQARDELFRQSQATISLLNRQLEDVEPGQLGAQARQLLEITRIVGGHDYVELAVRTPDGLRVISGEAELIAALPDGVVDRSVVEVDLDGQPVTVIARVVPSQRQTTLLLAIGRNSERFPASAVLRPLAVALIAGAFVVLLLSWLFARFVARRLDGLSRAAASLADGDTSARVPVSGDDEIAGVAHAFNAMAEQLEDMQQRERDFLMSVGHDLRTPLTTIRGYAEALENGQVAEDDVARVAGVLHRQADRLGRLIEDITLLTRLEAREFTLRPEDVDLTAHLKGIAEAYRGRVDEAHVHLVVDLDPVGAVLVDPDRVSQVVGNLMENALRYTPEGGTLTLSMRDVDGGVVIQVADTGPGIDPDDLPHIFDRLYVAQRYRPVRPEGSGLGLAIVKQLCDAMEANVQVTSTLGEGTAVTVAINHAHRTDVIPSDPARRQ